MLNISIPDTIFNIINIRLLPYLPVANKLMCLQWMLQLFRFQTTEHGSFGTFL